MHKTMLLFVLYSLGLSVGCGLTAEAGRRPLDPAYTRTELLQPKKFVISGTPADGIVFTANSYSIVKGYCFYSGPLRKISVVRSEIMNKSSVRITPIKNISCADYDGGVIAVLSEDQAGLVSFLSSWSMESPGVIADKIDESGERILASALRAKLLPSLIEAGSDSKFVVHYDVEGFQYELTVQPVPLTVTHVSKWQ